MRGVRRAVRLSERLSHRGSSAPGLRDQRAAQAIGAQQHLQRAPESDLGRRAVPAVRWRHHAEGVRGTLWSSLRCVARRAGRPTGAFLGVARHCVSPFPSPSSCSIELRGMRIARPKRTARRSPSSISFSTDIRDSCRMVRASSTVTTRGDTADGPVVGHLEMSKGSSFRSAILAGSLGSPTRTVERHPSRACAPVYTGMGRCVKRCWLGYPGPAYLGLRTVSPVDKRGHRRPDMPIPSDHP